MGHGAGRFRGRQHTVGQVRGLGCKWAGLGHPVVQWGPPWVLAGLQGHGDGARPGAVGVWGALHLAKSGAAHSIPDSGARVQREGLQNRQGLTELQDPLFISSYPTYQNERSFISK